MRAVTVLSLLSAMAARADDGGSAIGLELLGASGIVSATAEIAIAPRVALSFGIAPWARVGDQVAGATLAIPVGVILHPLGVGRGLVASLGTVFTPLRLTLTEHGDTFTDVLFPRFSLGGGWQLPLGRGYILRPALYLTVTQRKNWTPIGQTPQRPAWDVGPWAGLLAGATF